MDLKRPIRFLWEDERDSSWKWDEGTGGGELLLNSEVLLRKAWLYLLTDWRLDVNNSKVPD